MFDTLAPMLGAKLPESWFQGHEWRTRCCFKVQTNAGGKFWMMFIYQSDLGNVYYLGMYTMLMMCTL